MRTRGNYQGAQRTLQGDLCVFFSVEDDPATLQWLEDNKEKELVIEVKKYNEKRSLNANAYFWKLCDELARVLHSDKDTVYLLQLKKYGVFEMIEVVEQAAEYIKPLYRLVEVDHSFVAPALDITGLQYSANMLALKCYIGSSHYDSKEMAHLIDGTVNDCMDLGIDTWTQEEIDNLVNNWVGRGRYETE